MLEETPAHLSMEEEERALGKKNRRKEYKVGHLHVRVGNIETADLVRPGTGSRRQAESEKVKMVLRGGK